MKTSKEKPEHLAALHADCTFHVYNRTNNQEILFRDDNDRRYFLKKYAMHVAPYLYTLSYCLLDNHFHLLVRIKSEEDILAIVVEIPKEVQTVAHQHFLQMPEDGRSVHEVLERQFSRLFTAYAMYFNTRWKRKGNLFYRPFKRLPVRDEAHFTRLIYYIHNNPEKHRISDDFTKYRWSSYQALASEQPTLLARSEVLAWFGGQAEFINFHQELHDSDSIASLLFEEVGN